MLTHYFRTIKRRFGSILCAVVLSETRTSRIKEFNPFLALGLFLYPLKTLYKNKLQTLENSFFSIWVFFPKHSSFKEQQGKREAICPFYLFHALHGQLDISRVIAAESSPLHVAGSRTRIGNLWFPSTNR